MKQFDLSDAPMTLNVKVINHNNKSGMDRTGPALRPTLHSKVQISVKSVNSSITPARTL